MLCKSDWIIQPSGYAKMVLIALPFQTEGEMTKSSSLFTDTHPLGSGHFAGTWSFRKCSVRSMSVPLNEILDLPWKKQMTDRKSLQLVIARVKFIWMNTESEILSTTEHM